MKKALSIILCLSMIVSTFSFALPAMAIDMNGIGIESAEEFETQTEDIGGSATLAADKTIFNITFEDGQTLFVPDSGTTVTVEADGDNHFAKYVQDNRAKKMTYTYEEGITAGKYVLSFRAFGSTLNDRGAATSSWTTYYSIGSIGSLNDAIVPGQWSEVEYEFTVSAAVVPFKIDFNTRAGLRWPQYTNFDDIKLVQKPEACTIKFDLNGAETTVANMPAETGTAYTLPDATTVSRDYYNFKGWAFTKEATEGFAKYEPSRANFAANTTEVTLYAVWEAKTYDVNFDGNGATSASFEPKLTFREADGAQKVTLPVRAQIEKTDYVLTGWTDGTDTYRIGEIVSVDKAATFTAVWKKLSDFTYLAPTAVSPKNGAVGVDMRYPVAYYTFEADVNADDVNLENVNNSAVGGIYYDAAEKTVWVFPAATAVSAGTRISFNAWDSFIPTADGKSMLSFTSVAFTLDSTMPDNGENLTPFADMEHGWNPFKATSSGGGKVATVTEADGNKMMYAYLDNSGTNRVWLYASHPFNFRANTTYKIEADIMFAGNSNSGASTSRNSVISNFQYADGTTSDHTGVSANIDPLNPEWVHISGEKTIGNTTNTAHSMSFFSNPPSLGAINYYIDNLKIYEKVAQSFDAGLFTTLTGTQPVAVYGYNGDSVALPSEMPYTVKDSRWTIDGWTDGENTYAIGADVVVDGAKVFTPNVVTTETTHVVSFTTDVEGIKLPLSVKVIEGDILDLSASEFTKISYPTYRFLGWSTDGTAENVTWHVGVTEDIELTAVFEFVDSWTFNSEEVVSEVGMNLGTIAYDASSDAAVVTPDSDSADAYITTQLININANDYDKLEITYDTFIGDSANKFTEDNDGTMVYFAHPESSFGWSGSMCASGKFKEFNEDGTRITYTYDLGSNASYNGTIARLRIDPYNGTPAWGVASIKFIKNTPIDTAVITGITAPVLRAIPDTSAVVPSGASYKVSSFVWSPSYNARFSGDTVYTAKVTLAKADGYRFTSETTATIDGKDAVVTYNADGTLTAEYTYPKTEPLQNVTVAITNAADITNPDGSIALKATVTPADASANIDTKDVVWTVDNSEICEITDKGVLTGFYNGVVNVTATSVYDPTKSATATINISNQIASYEIKFDKATNAAVTNMPDTMHAKRNVVLPTSAPVRDGFKFAGWVASKDSQSVIETAFVSSDVTFYALWCKGDVTYEYDKESDRPASYSGVTGMSVNTAGGYLEFTTNYRDPMINLAPNLNGDKFKTMEIRFATDAASGGFSTYFTSKDADGNYISWPYDSNSAHQQQFAGTLSTISYRGQGLDNYITIKFDMSSKANWTQSISSIRMDPIEGNEGAKFRIDYIRFVNYANEEYSITGVEEPVVKNEASYAAVSTDTSKYTVKNVTWTPTLLYDYYFDGEKEYTANVTIEAAAGWALSNGPFTATINGKEASYVLNSDDTATLSCKFPATDVIDSTAAVDIKLYSMGDDGQHIYDRMIFLDRVLDLANTAPQAVPSGYRWIGWSPVEDDATGIIDSLTATVDTELYAIYEPLTEFDFSNKYHHFGMTVNTGALSFEDNLAVVTPSGASQDIFLRTPYLGLNASDFGFVEVVYDASLSMSSRQEDYPNKFSATFKPALYFSLASSENSFTGTRMGTIVKGEAVTIDGKTFYKYTYDMSSNANWAGTIGKLRLYPYNGFPMWGVRSIKLIPTTEKNENVNITSLDAPATWVAPDTTAEASRGYTVESVSWAPALNSYGRYEKETAYTATIKVRPATGTKLGPDMTASVGSDAATAVVDTDTNRLTITYTFAATDPLTPSKVVITGATTIQRNGRYEQMTGKTVANDGSVIPFQDVTWSIRNADPSETTALADITETGRVYPVLNGDVIVTATSIYDPTVYAEHTITISGQTEKFAVNYDKNTTDDVTGMPEVEYAKGTHTVSNAQPVRSGYVFSGWSTSDESTATVSSIGVTEPITLYAVWAKCAKAWEFNTPGSYDGLSSNMSETSTVANGVLDMNTTSSDPIIEQANVNIDGDVNKMIQIRMASNVSSSFQIFFTSSDGITTTPLAEANSVIVNFPATGDKFTLLTFDMSRMADWKNTISYIRFDPTSSNGSNVKIDYIRVVSPARNVTLDANGGTIRIGARPTAVYTQEYNVGNVSITRVPTRDGYKFMGWSKDASGTGKLYSSTFPVTDDVTLYAIWNPSVDLRNLSQSAIDEKITALDETTLDKMTITSDATGTTIKSGTTVVTPVINVADSMEVEDSNKTILINCKFSYKSLTDDQITLRFKKPGDTEYTNIKVAGPLGKSSSGETYISSDLSGIADFDGTITDVQLVLQTGVVTSYTVSDITFTDAATAKAIIDEAYSSSVPSVSTDGSSSTNRKPYDKMDDPKPSTPTSGGSAPIGVQTPASGSTTTPGGSTSVSDITSRTSGTDTITFHFDSDADMALIGSYRQMTRVSMTDSILTVRGNGFETGKTESPSIFTSGKLAIDAASHKYIVFRAKNNMSDKGCRVYFRTENDGFAESRAKKMSFTEDYSLVVYDMSTVAGWSGTITGMFFSFGAQAGGLIDIDYIMFTNTIPEDKPIEPDFPYVNEFTAGHFEDVKSGDWFYGDVEKSYKMGLMNGNSDTIFDPEGSVTVAEAVTVAARLNAIYNDKTIASAAEGEEWYTPYVNYAITARIIKQGQFTDFAANATRREVAQIFYSSMSTEWFKKINVFNSVPDVPAADAAVRDILALYNSGVIIGVDDAYNFKPDTDIKRSEISAIINRVALPASRQRVVTQDEIDSLKVRYEGSQLLTCALGNCTAEAFTMKDGVATGTGKANDAGRADPIVYFGNKLTGKLDAGTYKTIKIGLKWNAADIEKPSAQIFFTTANGSWAAERMITGTADGAADANGVVTYTFNCGAHGQWTGEITDMRFDPFDAAFDFGIAFVELIP